MNLFKDFEKQLNLHPLVVNIILTANEKRKYAKIIAEWNENPLFHCGLFQFKIVTRTQCHSAELSGKLANKIDGCNVMIRLFDDGKKKDFCYFFQRLPFGKDKSFLERRVLDFIDEVCRHDTRRLHSDMLHSARDISPEKKETVYSLIQAINHIISTFHDRKEILGESYWLQKMEQLHSKPLAGHTDYLFNGPALLDLSPSEDSLYNNTFKDICNPHELHSEIVSPKPMLIPKTLVKDYHLIMSQLQGKETKEAMERIMAMVEDIFNTTSDDIASRFRDRETSLTSGEALNIKIEVKKIITSITKTGRQKKSYGVEFTIDGRPTQVYFGGTDATMIFISSLIKQVAGSRFYRKYMLLPLQEGSIFSRDTMIDWLETLYKTLYPGARTSFDEWYRKMRTNPHIISQGKSTCVRKVTKALQDNGNGPAIPYCVLQSREDREGLFYALNLPATVNVILPPELEKLLAG